MRRVSCGEVSLEMQGKNEKTPASKVLKMQAFRGVFKVWGLLFVVLQGVSKFAGVLPLEASAQQHEYAIVAL